MEKAKENNAIKQLKIKKDLFIKKRAARTALLFILVSPNLKIKN
jgi:hypothetical protein